MLAVPTTKIRISRRVETGDEEFDTYFPHNPANWPTVAANVPASMLEQAPIVTDEGSGEPNTVRYFKGRVDPSVDIRPQDHVFDDNNAEYVVDFVSAQQSFAFVADTRFHARLLNFL